MNALRHLKRAGCVLTALCCCASLCGCMNRPITQLAIVVGLGFDSGADNLIEITAQIVIPSNLGQDNGTSNAQGSQNAAVNVTVSGKTSFEAVRNLLARINRKAYFAHVQILVLGSELAKGGISRVWDFLERDNEFNRTMRVVVVKDGTAKALFEENADIEKLSSIEIEDTLDSSMSYGKSVDIKSFEVVERLSYPNTGIVLGLIDPKDDKQLTKADVSGGAVLRKSKLVGYLGDDEVRGYLFGVNQIKSTILVVENPEEKGKKVSLETIRSVGSLKATIENGKPVCSIQVDTTGDLGDVQGSTDLVNERDLRKLEQEAAATILTDIRAAVVASQQFDCDIFNFSDLLYRNDYPAYRKIESKWESAYRTAKVNITVNFHLDRAGLVRKPAYTP